MESKKINNLSIPSVRGPSYPWLHIISIEQAVAADFLLDRDLMMFHEI